MQSLIAQAIRRLKTPKPKLEIPVEVWSSIITTLRSRGCGQRESAAFLLGYCHPNYRECMDFIPHDDLDPHCLKRGAIDFDGAYYHKLWEICKRRKCDVVADIHTHPSREFISVVDREHPSVGRRGHIGLIVPFYAMCKTNPEAIGIYQFLGGTDWRTVRPKNRKKSLILLSKRKQQ